MLEVLPDAIDRVLRLEALLAWPPDPRIGTAAKRWLETPPVHGKNRPGFFKTLWKLIEYTRDARLAPLVAKIGESRSLSINRYGLRSWTSLVELATHFAALPAPAALSASSSSLLERIEALLDKAPVKAMGGTTADEAELFARIYEDPNDDEARVVLADLLQQRNDPRGEFIALQLARYGTDKPSTAREKKLIQQWGRAWLGPLDACLLKEGIVFERGFVTRGRYDGTGSANTEPPNAREWSTFTHLDVSIASKYVGGSSALLLKMPGLRHVIGLSPQDLARLEPGAPFPWETVGFRLWSFDHERLSAAGKMFPAARSLIISGSASGPLNAPLVPILALLADWRKVRELELAIDIAHMAGILESPRGKQLTRLTVHSHLQSATIKNGKLTLDLFHSSNLGVEQAANLIRALRPTEVVADGMKRIEGEEIVTNYRPVPLAPIIGAARELGIPLHVKGVKLA